MAAALTWDSLPHALRSLSGWPFLSLLSGIALEFCLRQRTLRPIIVLVSAVYWATFMHTYFVKFPQQSGWWFDVDVTNALGSHRGDPAGWQEFLRERRYPEQAARYFEYAYFGRTS